MSFDVCMSKYCYLIIAKVELYHVGLIFFVKSLEKLLKRIQKQVDSSDDMDLFLEI